MKGPYRVTDCNRHVIETAETWEFGPSGGAHRAVVSTGADDGPELWVSGTSVTSGRPSRTSHHRRPHGHQTGLDGAWGSRENLADMDRQGIDVAILLPTDGQYVCWSDGLDAGYSTDLMRSYNSWLREYCGADAERLRGVALLALEDIPAAVDELRRSVDELGFVGAVIRPNPVRGRRLHDRAYDPLYEEAQRLNVPILVNGGIGTTLPEMGADRFSTLFGRKAVGDTFEILWAFLSFVGNGVFERIPGLQVGFVGAGCGWLPYWTDRIEEHWDTVFGADSPARQSPRLEFEAHCFVVADPWETLVPDVFPADNDGVIVWGSHYPEPEVEATYPDEVDLVVNSADLTHEQKAAILSHNAERIFGL
jgi:predicted TIM-barrel fold metal-dependent hydrolase